jgi:hypothetical protein
MWQGSHSSCWQLECDWRRLSGCFSGSQTFQIEFQSVACQNYFHFGKLCCRSFSDC